MCENSLTTDVQIAPAFIEEIKNCDDGKKEDNARKNNLNEGIEFSSFVFYRDRFC
jgi:hypothetical protein